MPTEVKVIICQDENDAKQVAAEQNAAGAQGACTLCNPARAMCIKQLPVMLPTPACGKADFKYSAELSSNAPDTWVVLVERTCP